MQTIAVDRVTLYQLEEQFGFRLDGDLPQVLQILKRLAQIITADPALANSPESRNDDDGSP